MDALIPLPSWNEIAAQADIELTPNEPGDLMEYHIDIMLSWPSVRSEYAA